MRRILFSIAFPSTVRERRMDLKPDRMSVEQKFEERKMVREKGIDLHEEIKMRKERQNYKIKNGQNSSLFQPVWKKAGAFPLRREKIQRLEWRLGKGEARERMKMMMERRQELQLEGERRWEDYKSIMVSVPQYQDRTLLYQRLEALRLALEFDYSGIVFSPKAEIYPANDNDNNDDNDNDNNDDNYVLLLLVITLTRPRLRL